MSLTSNLCGYPASQWRPLLVRPPTYRRARSTPCQESCARGRSVAPIHGVNYSVNRARCSPGQSLSRACLLVVTTRTLEEASAHDPQHERHAQENRWLAPSEVFGRIGDLTGIVILQVVGEALDLSPSPFDIVRDALLSLITHLLRRRLQRLSNASDCIHSAVLACGGCRLGLRLNVVLCIRYYLRGRFVRG